MNLGDPQNWQNVLGLLELLGHLESEIFFNLRLQGDMRTSILKAFAYVFFWSLQMDVPLAHDTGNGARHCSLNQYLSF